MEIKNVAVAGAGTMGNGIAHVFAAKGFNITLLDTTEDMVKRGVETIRGNLARQVKKGLINEEEQNATMSRIKATTDTRTLSSSHLVIEAIFEDLQVKNRFWSDVDKVCPPEVIFASNTSSLPITQIAAATSRKDKFIGMHFMNPVPLMKLVEVIRGMATSDETCHSIKDLCLTLDKTPVEVNDYPGFVANRILMPMINEAIFTLMEGVSSRDEIDTVMKLGANHPMGPLTLADFIGLDVCLAIMETLYTGYSDSKYRPCPLLRKMVQSGWLGRKTKKGFYDYE
ncbi:MAG: 3-hydroxybutyryl-CoA dehydrogenase [candidate division Zixibacteria bacterium]|jgi:3-hydroxybutyryl-CoA dehydrogenase|nr:3-hydroxybutyryl-CoA dehydrogenase [candidate division Zixibacteria bacterium]